MDRNIVPIVWFPAEYLSRGGETMKARLMLVGVVLLGILLATSGVIQAQPTRSSGEDEPDHGTPMPPAGQEARYVLPYYTSQTLLEGARSVTVVNVYNQSTTTTCEVGVQFQFAFGTTNVCSISLSIPPTQSRLFCSRPVNDPLFPCTVSCPGAGLTFNTGHAFVSSTSDFRCAEIAVDAQLAFTRDPADNLVEGITKLSIIRINEGNFGD
jgi:hypothetical protein